MRSHRRLKKEREEKSWRMSSFGLLLSFYLGRCSSEFFFLSFFFFFISLFFLHCLYLPESRLFFFLLLFRSRDERLFWLERFQLIFPMVFHGKWRDIIIIYFLKWRKNWRKLLIFKLNIGFQIYRDVVSTFDQHLNYFFLRLLLHRKLFSKLFHG